MREPPTDDFYFVQLSDCHWGFEGPPNPDAKGTLPKAVAAVNALPEPPDFVVFTGDLTHITEDARERRRRLAEFKEIVSDLKVKDVRFMPGEHDAVAGPRRRPIVSPSATRTMRSITRASTSSSSTTSPTPAH